MRIELLDVDEFVRLNELDKVDDPIIFQRGGIPTATGLLSNEIFGMNVKSRRNTFAYIDLKTHLLAPHAYKALNRVYAGIDRVIAGQRYVSIKDGKIVDDPNGDTGMDWLYENWNKITWERSPKEAAMRKERLDMLTGYDRDTIFLDKFIVIPVFYRDINTTGGGAETDPLNTLYSKLIRLAAIIMNRDMFDFSYHGSIFTLQRLLVEIYDTFKRKLEKKNGMIRKYLMGKNVSYCTRTVISNPLYHASSPKTLEIPFDTVGIPLGQACVLAYPFIMRWLKVFFEREFMDVKEVKTQIILDKDHNPIGSKTIRVYKPELYFDEKYIRNLIDTYVSDPESRFDPIMVPVREDGSDKTMMYYSTFSGKKLKADSAEELAESTGRPFTITDVLFLAATDALKDKHVVVTRYPVSDAYGMFIAKCRPISTITTDRVTLNGEVYEYYPHIDLKTPRNRMHIRFIDSAQFSNAYLAGLNGDLTTPSGHLIKNLSNCGDVLSIPDRHTTVCRLSLNYQP